MQTSKLSTRLVWIDEFLKISLLFKVWKSALNSDWKCEQGSKMFKPLWRHRGQPLHKALVKKDFRWWTWLEINGIIWISLFILAYWCNWIQPPERFLQPHWLVWLERMRIRMDREKLAVSQILSGDKIPLRRVKKVPTASWWPCWHREWQNIFLGFYDRQFLKVHIWFGCKTFQDCNKTVALILVSARVSWIPWNRGRSIWVGDIMASLSLWIWRGKDLGQLHHLSLSPLTIIARFDDSPYW